MSRITAIVVASAMVLAPAAYAQTAPQTTAAERERDEVAETVRLNQQIVARNEAAAQREAADRAAFERDSVRWREESARLAAQRSQWEADRAQWEREKAAWEADCRRSGEPCGAPPQD